MRVGDSFLRLGDSKPHGGGRVRKAEVLPPRTIVDEGVEFESVWYPHRDALSLLRPCGRERTADCRDTRGRLAYDSRTYSSTVSG